MTLDELQKLCDEATPGPWRAEDYTGKVRYGDDGIICQHVHSDSCAAFIAAARTYLPKLIAVARAAKAMVQESRIREAMNQDPSIPLTRKMAFNPKADLQAALAALDALGR